MDENRDFLSAISNPFLEGEISSRELESIVDEYPYFHSAWLLFARSAKLENRGDFQSILKKTAIRAHSRENLYYLIHAESVERQEPFRLPDFEFPSLRDENTDDLLEHEKGVAAADYFQEDYEPAPTDDENADLTGERSFFEWLEKLDGRMHRAAAVADASIKEDIIERFLQQRPKPISFQEGSIAEDEEESGPDEPQATINTETMARIYVAQKLFDKAIKVYENLGLKNPEKSAYFAGQIEKIKNRIHNQ